MLICIPLHHTTACAGIHRSEESWWHPTTNAPNTQLIKKKHTAVSQKDKNHLYLPKYIPRFWLSISG